MAGEKEFAKVVAFPITLPFWMIRSRYKALHLAGAALFTIEAAAIGLPGYSWMTDRQFSLPDCPQDHSFIVSNPISLQKEIPDPQNNLPLNTTVNPAVPIPWLTENTGFPPPNTVCIFSRVAGKTVIVDGTQSYPNGSKYDVVVTPGTSAAPKAARKQSDVRLMSAQRTSGESLLNPPSTVLRRGANRRH